MSAEEEIEEQLHHAENPFDKTVAGSMAIIAALLAVVSVLGQHFNTEELLLQQQSSDQWAFSQAKDIRRYTALIAEDTLRQANASPALIDKYTKDADRYRKQHDDIQEQAREYEKERDRSDSRANSFHLGEIFLEVAIVFSSLCILMKTKPLFFGGIVAALIGIVISMAAWWI